MASEDVIAWDEEEKFSEWGWDDEGFAEYDDIIRELPNLSEVQEIVEEEEL